MKTEQEMYPNVYKITYQEMEGDNYAGGIVTKVTYLEDINMLLHYRSKIIGIQPVYAQFLPELSSQGIEMLIQQVEYSKKLTDEAQEAQTLIDDIARAEARLKKLRGE